MISQGIALLLASAPLYAQVPPDSGQFQRQLEQERQRPAVTPPPSPQPQQAAPTPQGPRVTIHRVKISGATLIPDTELAQQFTPYLNRPLALSELQAAAQRLVGYYRERGWFARVLLPEQDVSDGTLRLQIVEGHFGRLRVEPGSGRVNRAFVARVVGHELDSGAPYSLAQLERGLLLANDLPGVQADGMLRAGQAPGSSDLQLRVTDQPLVGGFIGANNYGNRFTGPLQGFGTLRLDNPSGYGDQLQLSGLRSERLGQVGADYSLPLGYDGLRASLGYSQLHYRLGKEFADLDAHGQSHIVRAGLSYPLLRSSQGNLWWGLNASQSRLQDEVLGQTLRHRDLNTLALELRGNARDGWGGGGVTSGRLALRSGRAELENDADRIQDARGAGINGSYGALSLDLRRDQALTPSLYLRGRFAGQYAFANLASAEQFSLGGVYGVRGYPVNEGNGDSGALLQLELHSLLPALGIANLDGYVFFDAGVIRQHQTPWHGWDTADSGNNTYGLYSSGLGLAWTQRQGFAINGVLAAPLGNNPGSGRDDRDQDGSRTGPRFWLIVSQSF